MNFKKFDFKFILAFIFLKSSFLDWFNILIFLAFNKFSAFIPPLKLPPILITIVVLLLAGSQADDYVFNIKVSDTSSSDKLLKK